MVLTGLKLREHECKQRNILHKVYIQASAIITGNPFVTVFPAGYLILLQMILVRIFLSIFDVTLMSTINA